MIFASRFLLPLRSLSVGACLFALTLSAGVSAKPPAESYSWRNVPILGGGFVTGVVFNSKQPGLVYARTDVGGAYRWLPDEVRWRPLNDDLAADDSELLGVLSVATDSVEPRRVYLAAGQYLAEWGKSAALLSSSDYGASWRRTPLPFKLGGNAEGRSTGERLQIDPHQNSRLLLGTNQDGLWLSEDFARTWKKMTRFPAASVTLVLFDGRNGTDGETTRVIYVGANDLKGSALYRSSDDGKTWSPIPGQPSGLIPHHAALDADGTLFITYGNNLGPNDVTHGAVWKYSPADSKWTDISPEVPGKRDRDTFGYSGLALDAKKPGTILVSTLNRWTYGDEIFRSNDGGKTWKPTFASATWDVSAAPYVEPFKPHWLGDVDIDPFDSGHVYFITGYGLWGTKNITVVEADAPVGWSFSASRGIEETVPLALVSPPEGAPLVSALGDYGGFRHDDITSSTARGVHKPMHGTNRSIDFAEGLPSKMVRSHSGDSGASLSLDGATTWTDLPAAPPTVRQNGPGKIAISAGGKILVWVPKKSVPYFSADDGKTWTASTGTFVSSFDFQTDTPVADRADPLKFYLYDVIGGGAWYSHDGGRSFAESASKIPPAGGVPKSVPGYAGHVWIPTDAGLFHSTAGGVTYAKWRNVRAARQVGFGKAAEGQRYPAIYLAGKVGREQGIFRSDDGGQSWRLLSNARTRFGAITAITGDARTYGRVYLGTGGRGIIVGEPQ